MEVSFRELKTLTGESTVKVKSTSTNCSQNFRVLNESCFFFTLPFMLPALFTLMRTK